MSFLNFFSLDNLGMMAVVVIVLIAFLKDFNMTSKRSWVVVIGLTVTGERRSSRRGGGNNSCGA